LLALRLGGFGNCPPLEALAKWGFAFRYSNFGFISLNIISKQ
jgi:hypothetical protein